MSSASCWQFLQKLSRGSQFVTHLDLCTFPESQVLVTLGHYLKPPDAREVCFLCYHMNHIGFTGKDPTQKCGLLQVVGRIQTTPRNSDGLWAVETNPPPPISFWKEKESEEELNDMFQL